ncbi:thiol-disulfide oxidoreductase DCC family protein [Nocardiopsis composta]|uniref:Putative DCC family thiol-disulfide oxidoreductase YuxK n=1 Tax=Nocardiopsis composta TaxID=157465 RepID=A0A7W8QK71_9ACTN|nr:DUF393 domain-containing protein [Nocardiopsis composta]MBB5431977.1 putative DCC family thiol-disulfide oxidoreductase YuxK [Nocardiopsis composta]
MTETRTAPRGPVLVYDGDCGFCTSSVRLAERRLAPGVRAVPWQRAGLPEATERRALEEVLLLHPDGRRIWGGSDAVAVLLLTGPHRALRPLGLLLRAPVLRGVGAAAYRWVARNRYRMPGGTPACSVRSAP